MGRRADKYPQSEWAGYADYEEELENARIAERDMLLDRNEKFQLMLVEKKMKSIDALATSIAKLADSIVKNDRPHVNVFITPDSELQNVDNTINKIKEMITN